MEPFRIHVADEMLDDLRARLRCTRWPDQVPGIRRGHVDGAGLFAGCLVLGAQHRSPRMLRRRGDLTVTGNDQRLADMTMRMLKSAFLFQI